MKRFSSIFLVCSLLVAPLAPAQDSSADERINRLTGQIEDLITAHNSLKKEMREIADQLDSLRDAVNKPNAAYLTSDDLKPLVDAIREVDRKRIADAEKIQAQLKEIQRLAAAAPPAPRHTPKAAAPEKPEKGYEYQVQPGDTLSTIIAAYREKNVKVTVDQVLKANPGLKPERMKVGQVVFIPAP